MGPYNRICLQVDGPISGSLRYIKIVLEICYSLTPIITFGEMASGCLIGVGRLIGVLFTIGGRLIGVRLYLQTFVISKQN